MGIVGVMSRILSRPNSLTLADFLPGAIRQRVRQRFKQWMLPRLKPARCHTLSNKRLFIVPSRAGFGFLLVVLLVWLTGTNYENNLILGLAFFLVALFVVCIHHTFFNLSGLSIEALRTAPCFQGESGEVQLRLGVRHGVEKENIVLQFEDGGAVTTDLIDETTLTLKLFTLGAKRGYCFPPRLMVESRYPLGIIRCWSWLVFDVPILVYPKPLAGGDMPLAQSTDNEGDRLDETGAEDFHGFKQYQVGASPKHIAWKHYARGQGLHTKEYESYRQQQVWLDWDALEGPVEIRLSRLCYWVLKLSATAQPFGLKIPGVVMAPATGVEHKQSVLKALALFGVAS